MSDSTRQFDGGIAEAVGLASDEERFRNFVAVQDLPPQRTLFLEVSGEILVGNPGIDVELTYAVPQGINPDILLLNVVLLQRPGFWPEVLTWKPARYSTMLSQKGQYTDVQLDAPFGGFSVRVVDRQ